MTFWYILVASIHSCKQQPIYCIVCIRVCLIAYIYSWYEFLILENATLMGPRKEAKDSRKICERGVPGNFDLAQPPYIYICTYIWLTQPSFKFWTCSPCFVFIQTLKTCKCCQTVWDSLFLGHFDQMSSNLARSFFWWFMFCISFFLHPNSLYSKSFVIMSSLDSIF